MHEIFQGAEYRSAVCARPEDLSTPGTGFEVALGFEYKSGHPMVDAFSRCFNQGFIAGEAACKKRWKASLPECFHHLFQLILDFLALQVDKTLD